MCFPNGNSAPNCNPPLYSAWALGCYFLSHIYSGLPCFFLASGVSPVSSGSFACVAVALAGAGRLHLESPCPVLSLQCKTSAKWNKMLWMDDHQEGQGAGVQDKKGWEIGFAQPGKDKAKGNMTSPFHLARKGYREDGTRPFSEVHNIQTGRKGYELQQEKFLYRKKNKFPSKMVQHQNRAQSVCGCPPLETLKIQVDKALSILHYLWSFPAKSRAWSRQHPTVPLQPEILQSWRLSCLPGKCWGEEENLPQLFFLWPSTVKYNWKRRSRQEGEYSPLSLLTLPDVTVFSIWAEIFQLGKRQIGLCPVFSDVLCKWLPGQPWLCWAEQEPSKLWEKSNKSNKLAVRKVSHLWLQGRGGDLSSKPLSCAVSEFVWGFIY